jgi:hypothetical protein
MGPPMVKIICKMLKNLNHPIGKGAEESIQNGPNLLSKLSRFGRFVLLSVGMKTLCISLKRD